MCWHKWVWEEPEKEQWSYWETPWSNPLIYYKTIQTATCTKCGKKKRRVI